MPRPALWHKQSFTYGEGEGAWVRQGFEARKVAGYHYSWILRDPSGRWQIGYPSPQGGENRKRAFPRAWANRQIQSYPIGWQEVPGPLGSTVGKGT